MKFIVFACILLIISKCISGLNNVPPKPKIVETFVTWMAIGIDYFVIEEKHTGTGFWAKSINESRQMVNVTIDSSLSLVPGQNIFQLQRCDLNTTYFNEMDGENKEECNAYNSCEMVDMWSWIENAEYQGQQMFINKVVDVWKGQIANFTTAMIAVSPQHPSIPVLYQETDVKFGVSIMVQFIDFLPIQPPKPIFHIPAQCTKKNGITPVKKFKTIPWPFIFKLRNI